MRLGKPAKAAERRKRGRHGTLASHPEPAAPIDVTDWPVREVMDIPLGPHDTVKALTDQVRVVIAARHANVGRMADTDNVYEEG